MTEKIELTVHEFMTIMGALDEQFQNAEPEDSSLFSEWFKQWKALDERLEKLGMMEKADLLFDGKISINAISEVHFKQLLISIERQIEIHKKLIATNDEDADPEDLEMWINRLTELNMVNFSQG